MTKIKCKYLIRSFLFLLLVIAGTIPIYLLWGELGKSEDTISERLVKPLMSSKTESKIPRLMGGEFNSIRSNISGTTSNYSSINSSALNYAIGTQQGAGGGTYQAMDSFIGSDVQSLSTQNLISGGTPSDRKDSYNITDINGFTRNQGQFLIENVESREDWRKIENDTSSSTWDVRASTTYLEIAQELIIQENYANISEVRVYIKYNDITNGDGFTPTGNVSIFSDNSGEPGSMIATTTMEQGFGSLDLGSSIGPTWVTYTFLNPVKVTKGKYWLVLNDTSDQTKGTWDWYTQRDASTGNTSSWAYRDDRTTWYVNSAPQADSDLISAIRIVPTDSLGNYLTYSSPQAIGMTYNTTIGNYTLNSFTLKANSTVTHNFYTNTSVVFSLTTVVNYSYSANPISAISSYSVVNNSDARWNLTFTISKITTSYKVLNRTIIVSNTKSDWNATAIYWNNSNTPEYTNMENNVNVTLDGNPANKYTNGSSIMYVNASTLAENTTWHIWFEAPNYLYTFDLSEGGTTLSLPCQTYTMNDYNLDFVVGSTGNLTYWIDYPNGSQLLRKNIDPTQTTFSDLWDIDSTFDDVSEVNGTYNLQAFWNNSDTTQVGTYTRSVNMIVNTTSSYTTQPESLEVLIGTNLEITLYYNATHNNTVINNANVRGVPSWGTQSPESFNHSTSHGAYTFAIAINDTQHNPGDLRSVTIYAELNDYVSYSSVINFKVVADAVLNANISQELSLEWRENSTFEIKYNDTSGSAITGATISVDGDSSNTYTASNVYYFKFNSTKYGGVGSYFNLNITASHPNYLTKTFYFNLTIINGITDISSLVDGQVHNNRTDIKTISFANSSADTVTINVNYYHILTSDILDTSSPTVQSLVPHSIPSKETNNSWTISFDPESIGTFVINISFTLTNYADALFMFNLTVQKAQTTTGTKFVNNTEVYYAESYDFAVYWNNIDHNENITFTGSSPITIDASQKVQFLNRTGDLYWFRFSYEVKYVGVGSHSIVITFSLGDFESSSITVVFNVIKSPYVSLTAADSVNGSSLVNVSSTYTRHYSPNEFDNFSISLSYFVTGSGQILDLTISNIIVTIDPSIYYSLSEETNHNWTVLFNASTLGLYTIDISFSHENYTSLTFELRYRIVQAETTISDYDSVNLKNPAEGINASVKSGNSLDFWLVWQSEYGEFINDSSGVAINSSDVILLTTFASNGTHYFRFTAGGTGVVNIELVFGTADYSEYSIILHFQVVNRSLVIDETLSTHENGYISPVGYLQYGDRYYFYVFLNDSETGDPVDILSFTGLSAYNITLVNVSNGNHLFYYDAWMLAETSSEFLSIQFTKSNYESVTYSIRFYIKKPDSELITSSTTITTYLTQDVTFYVEWRSIPNSLINSTIVLQINSSTISSSELWVLYKGHFNGNYTFEILANYVGFFTVTLEFQSNYFISKSLDIEITILPIPTRANSKSSVTNNSIIGNVSPFYFSQNLTFEVQWYDDFNNSGIEDTNPTIMGNGSLFIEMLGSYSNGSHFFLVNAEELGFYEIVLILQTFDFDYFTTVIYLNISIMPTLSLETDNFTSNQPILVEEDLHISGGGYITIFNDTIEEIDELTLYMNNVSVPSQYYSFNSSNGLVDIIFSTISYHYGVFNLTIEISTKGYQTQNVTLEITLQGRNVAVTVTIVQGKTIERGQDIEIAVKLEYQAALAGSGASISLASLQGVNVTFYVGLKLTNGTILNLQAVTQTDVLGETSYIIGGKYTKYATGFTNVTVITSASSSGLPTKYSMSEDELLQFKITQYIDPLEVIIPLLGIVFTLLIFGFVSYKVNKWRVGRKEEKMFLDSQVEKSFEDIKSIRLIIARHESGLQFYSEKTISELATDTDALSGMSAAISTFMEELSETMSRGTDEVREKDKIEVMSREGLHLLVWHGNLSSLIIISETRLPDYFQERLKRLGHDIEERFSDDLKDFYSTDQIPSHIVKKLVRKYIPLHYFCAFVLNEGVLSLESIKMPKKYKKMLNMIKDIRFEKQGVQYFFSEQIISHLSKYYKRSEAIKFLNYAIEINLLIETSQQDIIEIGQGTLK
ncbi:MAG: hypothetical protein ACTSW1_18560 [Candidatus Hodarchaeales archaeon]